jgi:hypothetical protein
MGNLPALVISSITISQDAEGRFSLNDLHKAAGGEGRHKPGLFLALQQTLDLASEIDKENLNAGIPAIKTGAGRYGGSHAVKEVVYRYAMWISPAFELKVIRAYDALVTRSFGSLESLPPSIASQVGGIIKIVVHKQLENLLSIELPRLVQGELAKQQIGVRHGVTAGQVWKLHKLDKLKNGPQTLSRLLSTFGCEIDGGGKSEQGGRTAKMFDPDKSDKAMKSGLLEHCQKYIKERAGQRQLFAVPQAKAG